jgi:CheY-like chemotaxis protein
MKKVLIVDDQADIRALIKAILKDQGYEVSAAKDGIEGLKKLKESKFDLVLVDMFMPKMSGREMCEIMSSNPKINTAYAFLTVAKFSEKGTKELKRLGCMDYIQKPIDNEDFIRRVKKMLKDDS